MMEREAMICYMLGFIEAKKTPILRKDALILLDQTLNRMCQPVITEKEKELIQELGDQQSFSLLAAGLNRDQVKAIAKRGYV